MQRGRRVGALEMGGETVWYGEARRNGWFHIHLWWIKIGRDSLGAMDPSPRPDHTAQDSSTGKINPQYLWL